MECPHCHDLMQNTDINNVQICTCNRCHGIWVSGDVLAMLFKVNKVVDTPAALIRENRGGVSTKRYCVSCEDQPLKVINVGGVEIDSCEQCSGIFFDEHEIKAFLPVEGQDQEDIDDIKGIGLEIVIGWLLYTLFGSSG